MRTPAHVGIIPDGNRRWATRSGLKKSEGYAHGLAPGVSLLHLARESGVGEITYYGFTTDNTRRPAEQVAAFSRACADAVERIAHEPCSLLVVGRQDSPSFPRELLPYTRRTDLNGGGIRVNFLVNYGWEWDLSGAGAGPVQSRLRSHDISRIDLVVRWGGMRRLSGFLPVQSVYADFYVVDRLWPDFQPRDWFDALSWYDRQDVTLGG